MALSDVHAAIERALAQNQIRAAADIAEAALAQGLVSTMILNLAAWKQEEKGDLEAAIALLGRALSLSPADPLIHAAVGTVRRKQGRLDDAIAIFDSVTAQVSDLSVAWLERGYALEELGRNEAAADSYRRTVAIDPLCGAAYAGLASIAARIHTAADVEAFAAKALELDSHDIVAICSLASSEIEQGKPSLAHTRLSTLLRRYDLPSRDRLVAQTLYGDALDKLDEIDAAFEAYTHANELSAKLYLNGKQGHPGESQQELVQRVDASFTAVPRSAWSTTIGNDDPPTAGHAFLFGFPRSGTTLAENVLASAPGVIAIEERPTLADADQAFLVAHGGMAQLGTIDAPSASAFRSRYWQRVANDAPSLAGRFLIDMDPLKSMRLPIIARLFSSAKLLRMRRDPRDVVWSCFRHSFRMSAAAYEFSDLQRTATHYSTVMSFVERCIATMALDVHDLDYATLVTAFDQTTQDACRFLGLSWSTSMRDFSRTAQRRGVTTASVRQVRRPLYNGGGQWRRYERHLEPVLPMLQPWVDRAGLT